jgi:hypothetical protein
LVDNCIYSFVGKRESKRKSEKVKNFKLRVSSFIDDKREFAQVILLFNKNFRLHCKFKEFRHEMKDDDVEELR